MALSMYQASIPVFLHGFKSLSHILTKAESHTAAKKIDPSVLIHARLYPDMLPLARQVQIATDIAKGATARLAGVEVPSFPDNEATFHELQTRIARTIGFVEGFTPKEIDGSEGSEINLTVGGNPLKFDGQNYLLYFAIPNFYFHITTTYAILRHNGLEIGKKDFLGNIQS